MGTLIRKPLIRDLILASPTTLKIPSSGPRTFKEDYRYTTWDPLSGRAARPGTAQDGIMPAKHFMAQDGKGWFVIA